MHNIKIELCRLDWYSSSPSTFVLYKKMYEYMCKMFPSNRQKLKKRIYMKKVLDRLRHIDVDKRHNLLCHAKPILVQIYVT